MAMSARRYNALQNMANMGSGPEAATAARKLAGQPIGARVPVVSRSTGTMRGSIGGGVRAGTPANLPVRGAIGTGGSNLPVPYRAPSSPAVRASNAASTVARRGPARNPVPKTSPPRFKPRTMMGIGLGLGVAASVAMNRRGEGASSGRQSIYKY